MDRREKMDSMEKLDKRANSSESINYSLIPMFSYSSSESI